LTTVAEMRGGAAQVYIMTNHPNGTLYTRRHR
jgi:hypothetical protein